MYDTVTSSLSSTVDANSGTFQTAAFKYVIGLAEKALFRCDTEYRGACIRVLHQGLNISDSVLSPESHPF